MSQAQKSSEIKFLHLHKPNIVLHMARISQSTERLSSDILRKLVMKCNKVLQVVCHILLLAASLCQSFQHYKLLIPIPFQRAQKPDNNQSVNLRGRWTNFHLIYFMTCCCSGLGKLLCSALGFREPDYTHQKVLLWNCPGQAQPSQGKEIPEIIGLVVSCPGWCQNNFNPVRVGGTKP